jgi:hypothetical protein
MCFRGRIFTGRVTERPPDGVSQDFLRGSLLTAFVWKTLPACRGEVQQTGSKGLDRYRRSRPLVALLLVGGVMKTRARLGVLSATR